MHSSMTYLFQEGKPSMVYFVLSVKKDFPESLENYLLFFHFRFEIAIFILIFLNMVTMGIEHYNQSRAFTFTLEISNALFTTIFSLGNLNSLKWFSVYSFWLF